MKPSTSP